MNQYQTAALNERNECGAGARRLGNHLSQCVNKIYKETKQTAKIH